MEQTNKPGPDAEHLNVDEDDWQEAVKKALKKEKPPEGWPEDLPPEPKDGGGKD